MKLRITIGIGIAAILFAVGFSACKTEYIDTYKPEAKLLSIKIGELLVAETSIPVPVDEIGWQDEDFDMYSAEFNVIAFKQEGDLVDAKFEPKVSRGAKVKWGVANRTVRPNDFYDTRVPATFDAQDFIYFMVTSEDNKITSYYRFATYLSSPVKELSSIKVAGREGDMDKCFAASTWNGGVFPGIIHITGTEATGATIEAVPWADTASLRYAVTPNAKSEPIFGEGNTLPFEDGNFLYVEVTAENSEVNIYSFTVYVSRIATIKKLTFISPNTSLENRNFEALGKGTGKYTWSDHSGAGSFESPHQGAGFKFAVELDDPDGHWEWAYINSTSLPGSPPSFTASGGNDATPFQLFANERYLAIKVIPKNRAAGINGSQADYYYKVKVKLLAADFKVQPKPAWYKQGETAEPLDFELDRDIANASYRWYEANSWYGGYGFDSKGRIGGKGAIIADPYFGGEDEDVVDGIAYNVSAWHVKQLDEKNNVSLHNGGNEFYRLPTPGTPVPSADGGTSKQFTPKTTYKPFLAGFSAEIHYYWVVVTDTDTGLTATSARAFVVTEWNQTYNLGQTVGAPFAQDKEHYIVDLHAYQTSGAKGLQKPPRNEKPFIAGNHGDEYRIPINFEDGFDVYDYTVFTAQALFFLADGRPWIQNWTQGDIGFGWDNPETGAYEELVLWYNLTNDNATRGLESSGNAPVGGGLKVKPGYVVIKPAGTKPLNKMPPFEDDGLTPKKNNDAQGWFTPYIELCELRFEGPSRPKPPTE